VVSSIRLSYRAGSASPLVVTQTLLRLTDRTAENRSGGPYHPFEPVEDTEPTFYLGVDQALPNDAVNLYVTVPPRGHSERLAPAGPAAITTGGGSTLAWEYWNGRRWAELAVFDGTSALTESGILQFIGPTDLEAAALFDQDTPRRWIRARLLDAAAADPRLLGGVFLNAVDAVQAATVRGEVLGTSNGSPGQRLRLSRTPVLAGQRILVREPERPPQPEEAELGREEGPDAVREAGGGQLWVRWHEVRSLVASGPRSRHYTLDRHSGEVRFGDGSHGLVPPFTGPGGIVAEVYRSGGGAAGNRPAGAVSRLTTSNPLLASVTNPAPAAGGSAAETLAGVRERGPQSLRHRDRAVTPEDFEWLARQASGTSVARARCLPNRNRELEPEPGWVTVIVVPEGTDSKLLPSVELVRTVEDELARRSLATLGVPLPSRVNVVGPGYVPVELEVAVRPPEPARSDPARKAVLAALDRFLHPLSGGPDGDGWAFGRDVFLSEVFAVLEALPDVEHVHHLAFRPTVATVPLALAEPHEPAPVTYPAGTVVEAVTERGQAVVPSGLSAVLAEPIPEGTPMAEAMMVVFQEGERVRVGAGADAVETVVGSVSGATLTVEPFRSATAYPSGAPVTALAGGAGSVLTAPVAEGTLVARLQVRGFLPCDRLRFPAAPGGPPKVAELAADGEERPLLGSRLRVPPFALVHSGAQLVGISER
jgi:Baseplate J-like protein